MGRCKDDFKLLYNGMGLNNALKLVILPRICSKLGIKFDINRAIEWFIVSNFKDIIIKYTKTKHTKTQINIPNIIWVFWWQGKTTMPPVIKQCYLSILRNANGRKVILLDKNNLYDYVTFSERIMKKFQNNVISITHFSDIIRVELLKKYGGLWIDAAIYVTKPIPKYNAPFFSPRLSNTQTSAPHMGQWVMGVMASQPDLELFDYMHDVLYAYWNKYDVVFSYLMFDYFIKFGYEHFNWIKPLIVKQQISSPDVHYSRYKFCEDVDEEKLTQLINRNTFLSLTYRIKYPIITTSGNLSYYSALLKRNKQNYDTKKENGGG